MSDAVENRNKAIRELSEAASNAFRAELKVMGEDNHSDRVGRLMAIKSDADDLMDELP